MHGWRKFFDLRLTPPAGRGILDAPPAPEPPARGARRPRRACQPPGPQGRPVVARSWRVPPRGARLRGGRPHFFPKKWGKRRRRGSAPGGPQYGGSWRRWAVRTGQRPGPNCRKFFRQFRNGRCRAPGGTHRDYPANLDNCCIAPTWPAGPPSVPCLRKTLAVMVVIRRGDLWSPAAQAGLRSEIICPVQMVHAILDLIVHSNAKDCDTWTNW